MKIMKSKCENAIKARINGEWDNADLMAIGALGINERDDIEAIKVFYGMSGDESLERERYQESNCCPSNLNGMENERTWRESDARARWQDSLD